MSAPTQEQVFQELCEYWEKRPELRLGQIVSNAFRVHPNYKRNPEPEIQDVFYMSNKHFLEGLKILSNTGTHESEHTKPT